MFDRAFDQSAQQEQSHSPPNISLPNNMTQSTADISAQINMNSGGSGGSDQMLQMLMEDTRYFRIGEKQYEFLDLDPIFTLN